MGREAGDHQDQQSLFDVVGITCPECDEYWEEIEPRLAQCPRCYHEFEVDDQTSGDDFVSSEPDPFESQEFTPLIETAGPLIYRNNGFRLTGLPVTASKRKVKDFEKLAKVGRATGLKRGPLPLTPALTQDENAIKSAVERLKDSDLRFVDEFFWFWPYEWNQPIEDDLLAALSRGDIDGAADILIKEERLYQRKKVATHNLAVLFHAAALDLEFESESRRLAAEEVKKRDVYWLQAFGYWEALIANKGFWKDFSSRIAQLEDPRFSVGQIKGSLPLALTRIVANLATRAAEKDDFSRAIFYIHLISGSDIYWEITSKAIVPFVRQLCERIKALCKGAKDEAHRDHPRANVSVGNLLAQAVPLIEAMRYLLNGKAAVDTQLLVDACGEVVSTAHIALMSFGHKAKGWEACAPYIERALSIATNDDMRERITHLLSALRERIEIERQKADFERRASWMDDLLREIRGILKSSLAPEAQFGKLREIAHPRLDFIKQEWGETSSAYPAACDALVEGIRSVALKLRNYAGQYQLALDATSLALNLCRNRALKERLRTEHSEITKEQLRRLEVIMESVKAHLGGLKEQIDGDAATLRRYKLNSDPGYGVDRNSYYNTRARHNSLIEEHTRLLAEYHSIADKYNALIRDANENESKYN